MRKTLVMAALALLSTITLNAQTGVDIEKIKEIRVPEHPSYHEQAVANAWMGFFRVRDREKPHAERQHVKIKHGVPETWEGVIAVGPEMALASGLVTQEELDKVKTDGYVAVGENDTVVLTGYRDMGSIYASEAFKNQLGLKTFPTNYGHVTSGELKTTIPPFKVSGGDPYLKNRFNSHLLRGLCQSQVKDMSSPMDAEPEICDPKVTKDEKDAIWPDHTAAFLVPKKIYMNDHPEYFAQRYGRRIGPDTPNVRVNVCLSDPDVNAISERRALEWVEKQKDRRWFRVADGDSLLCQCAQCYGEDYIPYYATDRQLRWVNNVADAIAEKYPDKMVSTFAYMETVKAPRKVKPSPNVVCFYCPWFWDSRNDSSKPIWHAKNVTAAEEVLEWLMFCPENFGFNEYCLSPRLFIRGNTGTLKYLVKNGMRYMKNCGTAKRWRGLSAYVLANLCVDPFLSVSELEKEYCDGVFGAAAEPMFKLLRLRDEAEETYGFRIFEDRKFMEEAPGLIEEALGKVADDPATARIIISCVASPWFEDKLNHLKGRSGTSTDEFKNCLKTYLDYQGRYFSGLPERHWHRTNNRFYKGTLNTLKKWGYSLKPPMDEKKPFADAWFRLVSTNEKAKEKKSLLLPEREVKDDDLRKAAEAETKSEKREQNLVTVAFDTHEMIKRFQTDATEGAAASVPELSEVAVVPGVTLKGVAFDLPLTTFPTQKPPLNPDGLKKIHIGSHYVLWQPESPIDIRGLNHVELRVWSSRRLPMKIRLGNSDDGKNEKLKADVFLQPGEQIVRVDLKNRKRGKWDHEKWMTSLENVEFYFYPQDQFYPFDPPEDVRCLIHSLTFRAEAPEPADLPYKGRAIWMTQYRSNVDFKNRFLFSPPHYGMKATKYQKEGAGAISMPPGREIREGFRTFTPHRFLAPVFAVVARDAEPQGRAFSDYLEKMFNVKLPVNPEGFEASPGLGNVAFIGPASALAAGRVKQKELDFVGDQGFMLRAKDGAIAIAGKTPEVSGYGVARYLEYLGCRFFIPGEVEVVPDLTEDFLRETVIYDHPWFERRPIPGGWKLMTQGVADGGPAWYEFWRSRPEITADMEAKVVAMSDEIKNLARKNQPVTAEVLKTAESSPLANFIAAKLLWNPMADASLLMSDFKIHFNND